jgi:ADP-ribosylglycohydrolase
MQAIWAGAHYTEAGVKSGNGNGSAMRSACLGVLLSGEYSVLCNCSALPQRLLLAANSSTGGT